MKRKSKQGRSGRGAKAEARESGVFVVPSHGRLARRGSTHVVDDETDESIREPRDRDGQAA